MKNIDPILARIIHRTDGGGFAIYLLQYLERRRDHLTKGDAAIFERAVDLLESLVEDSHRLEQMLGQSRAAHMAERGVSVRQELRIRDLEEEVDLLRRQVDLCEEILNSEHEGLDEGTERQGGSVRRGRVR